MVLLRPEIKLSRMPNCGTTLMNHFPCIVIRGICDYANSEKNKDRQEYAAIVTAAYTKELLGEAQTSDINGEPPGKEILNQSGRTHSRSSSQ